MIHVAVVSDIRLYRDGLVRYLQEQSGVEVVASASTALEGVRCTERSRPDIVLIDLMLSECHPTIREIRSVAPAVRIVALGLPEAEADFLTLAEAGVGGFVPRESSLAELVATLEGAARDELLVPPRAAAILLRRVAALSAGGGRSCTASALTTREAEVAHLLDDGKSNKEIAKQLGIEVATVKNHVHHILDKWKLRRRGEIPRMARAEVLRRV